MRTEIIDDYPLPNWRGVEVAVITRQSGYCLVAPEPPTTDTLGVPISFWIQDRYLERNDDTWERLQQAAAELEIDLG